MKGCERTRILDLQTLLWREMIAIALSTTHEGRLIRAALFTGRRGLRSHPGLKTGLRTRLTIHQRHQENRGRLVTDRMEKGGRDPAFFCCPPTSKRPTERNHQRQRVTFTPTPRPSRNTRLDRNKTTPSHNRQQSQRTQRTYRSGGVRWCTNS